MHQISLQEQHKAFMLVHGRLRKQQRKQDKYANKNRKDISYNVGDPVYWEKHKREGKIDNYFNPYYRVTEKVSPVTYIIRNQLDGTTQSVHADHIKLAKIDQWEIPRTPTGQPRRRAAYVVPPFSDDSDSESSDSQPENPRQKLIKLARKEREDSEDEDNVPLTELALRLRERERRVNEEQQEQSESEENAYASDDMRSLSWSDSEATVDYDYDSAMVDAVKIGPPGKCYSGKKFRRGQNNQVKTLLNAKAEFF